MRKSDLADIEVQLHAETEKAWRISTNGDDKDAKWMPKSQAELEPNKRGNCYILTAREQLLIEKGLV